MGEVISGFIAITILAGLAWYLWTVSVKAAVEKDEQGEKYPPSLDANGNTTGDFRTFENVKVWAPLPEAQPVKVKPAPAKVVTQKTVAKPGIKAKTGNRKPKAPKTKTGR